MPALRPMLGRYEVLEAVGKGGMATVYRGRDGETDQVVAIKVLDPAVASDPVLLKRFEHEIAVAQRLRHPHIVQGFDYGVSDGQPYLVMEFIDGRSLGQQVREHGPLAESEAVRIILEVADALQAAHDAKLVHRDVKPDNILLTADGRAKLADLGLIKDLGNAEDLTRTRTCLGTIAFIAPEQYEDAKRADARSDVYGLGATLYYALTGAAPFKGRRHMQILRKKLQNEFVSPRRLVPTLSLRVEEVLRNALDAFPTRRPATCREFIDCLGPAPGASTPAPAHRAEGELAGQPNVDSDERRSALRYPAGLDALCRSVHDRGSDWTAEIRDISVTGVRLLVNRRFEPGSFLSVEVQDQESCVTATLYVKVRWVRATAPRQWSLGCVFKHPLDSSELEALLGDKPKTVMIARE